MENFKNKFYLHQQLYTIIAIKFKMIQKMIFEAMIQGINTFTKNNFNQFIKYVLTYSINLFKLYNF